MGDDTSLEVLHTMQHHTHDHRQQSNASSTPTCEYQIKLGCSCTCSLKVHQAGNNSACQHKSSLVLLLLPPFLARVCTMHGNTS